MSSLPGSSLMTLNLKGNGLRRIWATLATCQHTSVAIGVHRFDGSVKCTESVSRPELGAKLTELGRRLAVRELPRRKALGDIDCGGSHQVVLLEAPDPASPTLAEIIADRSLRSPQGRSGLHLGEAIFLHKRPGDAAPEGRKDVFDDNFAWRPHIM